MATFKDPAAMIAAVGAAAFIACVGSALPAGEYLAGYVQSKFDGEERTALCARRLVEHAAEVGASLLMPDGMWTEVKDYVLANFSITEPDFEESRRRYDARAAAAHAQLVCSRFVAEARTKSTTAELQMFINTAKGDDSIITALAQLNLDGMRLDVELGALLCTYTYKATVKELIKVAVDKSRQIRAQRGGRTILRSDSHVAIAEAAIDELTTAYGTVVVSEQITYGFADGRFKEVPAQEVTSIIASLDGATFLAGEKQSGEPILAELRLREPDITGVAKLVAASSDVYAPRFFDDAPRGVAFTDVFVHLTEEGELVPEPLSPTQKQRARYEFDWNPDATAPMFDAAMVAWTGDTPDGAKKRQVLREWSGSTLVGAAPSFQRAILLHGAPGTAKSTFMQVEEGLFPAGTVSHVDPQQMSSDIYHAAELHGARINLAYDIPATEIVESSMLKKVIVGDPITVRQIRKEPLTFRPRAGHLLSANDLPPFRDRSGAVQDRFIPVIFDQRFRGQSGERRHLADEILKKELPGVVAQMLRAAGDLFRRGYFILPDSSEAALASWTRGNEPIAIWLKSVQTQVTFAGGRVANTEALYRQFAAWATSRGYRQPNLANFEKRLEAAVDPVEIWAARNATVLSVPDTGLTGPHAKATGTLATDCFRDFDAWVTSVGLPVPSKTAFGRSLAGIVPKARCGSVYYMLSLRAGGDTCSPAMRHDFVYDTETILVSADVPHPELLCGGWIRGSGEVEFGGSADVVEVLREVVAGDGLIIGHNVAFDNAVTIAAADDPVLESHVFRAYEEGRVSDTMIREMLIRIADGTHPQSDTGLGDVVLKYSGEALEKGQGSWQKRFAELRDIDPDSWPARAKAYLRGDVAGTRETYQAQAAQWPKIPDEAPQVRAAFALHLTGRRGVRVDETGLRSKIATLVQELSAAKAASEFFRTDGTLDQKSLQASVSVAYGGNAPLTEKSQLPRTDRETLASSGSSDLAAAADIAAKKQALGFAQALIEAGPEIRCHYNPLVASGRVSCSSPNLQQVPRNGGLREQVVPREGHVFVIADYKTLELCTLAQFCLDEFGESRMAELLQQNLDLHLHVGAKLLGIDYSEALKRVSDPEVKEHRSLAKGLNFGLPGGLGPDALVQYLHDRGFDIERDRAVQLKQEWLATYPEMTKLFAWASQQVRGGLGTIAQPRSGRLRGGTRYTAACNTVFQGLAADGAKEALWRTVKECRIDPGSPLYGSHPVIFVHDEIVLEAPVDRFRAAAIRLEQVMVAGMKVFTPDIPIKVDVAAADCWSKQAERLVDDTGNLLVWTRDNTSSEAS